MSYEQTEVSSPQIKNSRGHDNDEQSEDQRNRCDIDNEPDGRLREPEYGRDPAIRVYRTVVQYPGGAGRGQDRRQRSSGESGSAD